MIPVEEGRGWFGSVYPATPCDCLVSELRDALEGDYLTRDYFERRIAQWTDEVEVDATPVIPVEEGRRLLAEATPAEWRIVGREKLDIPGWLCIASGTLHMVSADIEADAALIVFLRNHAEALLDAAERAETAEKLLREAEDNCVLHPCLALVQRAEAAEAERDRYAARWLCDCHTWPDPDEAHAYIVAVEERLRAAEAALAEAAERAEDAEARLAEGVQHALRLNNRAVDAEIALAEAVEQNQRRGEALEALRGEAVLEQDAFDENVAVSIPIDAWRKFNALAGDAK